MNLASDRERKWYRIGKANSKLEEITAPVILGEYAFEANFLEEISRKIIEASSGKEGAGIGPLASQLNVSRAAAGEVLKSLASKKRGALVRQIFYSGEGWQEKLLSAFESDILKSLRAAGKAGLDPFVMKKAGAGPALERITALKLGRRLAENLFMDPEVLEDLLLEILEKQASGTILSISSLRDLTGLSRRYIIPIFGIMEERALVERRGDERIVL